MNRVAKGLLALLPAAATTLAGCGFTKSKSAVHSEHDLVHYQTAALEIDYPDVAPVDVDCIGTPPPRVSLDATTEYWDLTLEEAMRISLANSKVMKDLGGLVLRTPSTLRTVHDPSISYTDPRFGVEAALAAFDASFAANVFAENNDRALNNTFFGGGTRLLQQDLMTSQAQISKRTPYGTQYTVRSYTEYDANNAPGNAFPSAYTQWLEGEVRQPLLQGAGLNFNQIAGVANAFGQATAIPGVYNGVLIARINNDISLADFEISVRNFVNDVENAYLDLYFAYRDLQARIEARDAALDTWRRIRQLAEVGRVGGEAEKEAQAREQYFRFEEAVQNSLTGRLIEGTRTGSGSTGGTFRGAGVFVAERRLRLLMGIPITDGRLIRPLDEPHLARIEFHWDTILQEALMQRPELRRQRWEVKARDLELTAAKNFLLPQFDVVGRYRFRGFGDDLASPGSDDEPLFENAFDDLASGDFQESQLGMEFNLPFGFRRGHAAVRNAELRLARERALLQEQERTLVFDLSNAIADMDRAYDVALTAYNRRDAARTQYDATREAFEVDRASLDVLLDAQRRLADADSNYYRSLVEYALAVKNVHIEKGSLLDYNNIYLEEGAWPAKAYQDAAERVERRVGPLNDLPLAEGPRAVTFGPLPQLTLPPSGAPGTATIPSTEPGLVPAPAPTNNSGDDAPPAPGTDDSQGSVSEESATPFAPAATDEPLPFDLPTPPGS